MVNKITLILLAMLLSSHIYAGVCDATYSFNKALFYEGRGDHVTNLTFTETEIGGDFAVPVIKENPFDYRFPVEFKSQCAAFGIFPTAPSYANMAIRDSGTAEFTLIENEQRWVRHMAVQPFTGGPTAKNIMLMFLDTALNANDYVMEDSTDNNIYKATYGAAIYYDTLFLNGAPTGLGHGSFAWSIKFDTSYFMTDLRASSLNSACTDNNGWTENPDYTCTRDFRVQMLEVHYDTSGGIIRTVEPKTVNKIIIKSQGNGFEITLPGSTLPYFPTAEIYNIRGELIKQLSIVNGKYTWNGTSNSGQVNRGIYFLKINQETHKLFYNPLN